MNDLREEFEAIYARQHGITALQVKFERSATGGYRDPAMRAAWAWFKDQLQLRRAA